MISCTPRSSSDSNCDPCQGHSPWRSDTLSTSILWPFPYPHTRLQGNPHFLGPVVSTHKKNRSLSLECVPACQYGCMLV